MSNLFVYGTLLSQYRNPHTDIVECHSRHSSLTGLHYTQGWIDDFVLYWPPELMFPFIAPCKGKKVFGELYYDLDSVKLNELDIIEYVPFGYFERIIVKIHIKNGIENAFTYIGGNILRKRFGNDSNYEYVTILEHTL
ncbi:MAG TPA: gamma-glutamylcyclotransferase family protein [archaeon]|jgi:gamma-glutamylcyclotransferase (GGCT)/AIG2-like uncharacterized protein YtfP|nr:gamma-glutamylcyclotransferase family protein [archaeon]